MAVPALTPEEQIKRFSRRSFVWAGIAVVAGYETFHWLNSTEPSEKEQALPATNYTGLIPPLRAGLDFNEGLMEKLYSSNRLSPTFKDSDVTPERTNGDVGLDEDYDPSTWKLNLSLTPGSDGQIITLDEIKKLPRQEFVTELKCIEGWSIFVKWAGARFIDFHEKHPTPPGTTHVYMATPDEQYYVSIELPSMLHPQTLLCYEMNGQPLTLEHGAPLRLVIPHKYGVKNIKRLAIMRYASSRQKDYWAELGYDWYAGL
jgi:hypothetical protein